MTELACGNFLGFMDSLIEFLFLIKGSNIPAGSHHNTPINIDLPLISLNNGHSRYRFSHLCNCLPQMVRRANSDGWYNNTQTLTQEQTQKCPLTTALNLRRVFNHVTN